jgi:hypothetical protein
MFGILGGGFGLYGYLPAIAKSFSQPIFLLERYRTTLQARTDISHLDNRIIWCRDEQQLIDQSTGLVIVRRPVDQAALIPNVLLAPKLKYLILEKPLAPTPQAALTLLQSLQSSSKSIRIAYTFRFLPWAEHLTKWIKINTQGSVCVDWNFTAHHFTYAKQTWKRDPVQGGGALRFYGIHLVGLLAELGYTQVVKSKLISSAQDQATGWHATLLGAGLPRCEILLDSNSTRERFSVTGTNNGTVTSIFDGQNPFKEGPLSQTEDLRVGGLTRLIASSQAGPSCPTWYEQANDLWMAIEAK